MSKNLIPEICKMLGVELGEEFKIKELVGLTYKFDDKGLSLIYGNHISVTDASATTVVGLLNGEYEIEKLPWRPKKNQLYWTFDLSTAENKLRVLQDEWLNRVEDVALLKVGWAYRTKEEAEAALPKVATEIGVKYEL